MKIRKGRDRFRYGTERDTEPRDMKTAQRGSGHRGKE